MGYKEHFRRLALEPEYLDAERELRPFLDLADQVLALRLGRGWSQTELARRAGTKQANVSRIESGVANPTVKTLYKLAKAFGTEIEIQLRPRIPESAGDIAQSVSATGQNRGEVAVGLDLLSEPHTTWPESGSVMGRQARVWGVAERDSVRVQCLSGDHSLQGRAA